MAAKTKNAGKPRRTEVISGSVEGLCDLVASQAALLGAPARLKILLLVAQAPRSVEQIASNTGESVANTSQHLKRLRDGGLLRVEKLGLSRIYRLTDERIALLVENLFEIAELSLPTYGSAKSAVGSDPEWSDLRLSEIKRQAQREKAVLLDVRTIEEAEVTPVAGSVAIPLEALEDRASKLAKGPVYLVFCRGRACRRATEGVRILRAKGLKAFRIKESPVSLRYECLPLSEVQAEQGQMKEK